MNKYNIILKVILLLAVQTLAEWVEGTETSQSAINKVERTLHELGNNL